MTNPIEVRINVTGDVATFNVVERNNLAVGGLDHMANVLARGRYAAHFCAGPIERRVDIGNKFPRIASFCPLLRRLLDKRIGIFDFYLCNIEQKVVIPIKVVAFDGEV